MQVLTLARHGSLAGVETAEAGLVAQVIIPMSHDGVVMTGSAIFDSTGQFCFNADSLAKELTIDANGNPLTITLGPDARGKRVRKTYTYDQEQYRAETGWVIV